MNNTSNRTRTQNSVKRPPVLATRSGPRLPAAFHLRLVYEACRIAERCLKTHRTSAAPEALAKAMAWQKCARRNLGLARATLADDRQHGRGGMVKSPARAKGGV